MKLTLQVADKKAVTAADKIRDAVTQGTICARNLVNEPANVLGTEEFAQATKDLEEHGLEVEILDEKQMTQLGMGALLAVGYGSRRPSHLAIMKWNGGKKKSTRQSLLWARAWCSIVAVCQSSLQAAWKT